MQTQGTDRRVITFYVSPEITSNDSNLYGIANFKMHENRTPLWWW